MIKAVIFDLDGVLIDSEEMHYLAWKKMLGEDGISITAEDFSHVFGKTGNDILKGFYARANKRAEEKTINAKIDRKNVFFREIAAKMLKPSKGSVELLKDLKNNGLAAAIGTSTPRGNVKFYMEKTGLKDFFKGYVCADDITKGKPDPEVFLKAAALLKQKPEDCVVFEDAKHGIEAAKRGGMKCIAVASTHEKSELKGADLVISDLSEVDAEKIKKL